MACSQYGLEDSGKGKLSLTFMPVLELYPDSLPGGAQGRGDCVSWSTRNAALLTMCNDITSGKPDEVSGRLEGAPEISDTARLNGVLSTEAIYNWRRHGGDGWDRPSAIDVLIKESGMWLRKKYDEINVDFTAYSSEERRPLRLPNAARRVAGDWQRSPDADGDGTGSIRAAAGHARQRLRREFLWWRRLLVPLVTLMVSPAGRAAGATHSLRGRG
jgi:hypothetical protein